MPIIAGMDDSAIIDLLGGTVTVARLCKVKPPSVSGWRVKGIPDARRQFLDGFVSAAVVADQESALAVARNLNGCLSEAAAGTTPDQTTAILATAVRIELDSALEDVGDYIALVKQSQDNLRSALRTPASDARGGAIDDYLTFGDRMRDQLTVLRRSIDAVITAATPANGR